MEEKTVERQPWAAWLEQCLHAALENDVKGMFLLGVCEDGEVLPAYSSGVSVRDAIVAAYEMRRLADRLYDECGEDEEDTADEEVEG